MPGARSDGLAAIWPRKRPIAHDQLGSPQVGPYPPDWTLCAPRWYGRGMSSHRAAKSRTIAPRKLWTAAAVGALILIGAGAPDRVAGHATKAPGTSKPAPGWWKALTPCPDEEGAPMARPCQWNAAERGNGQGRSFVVMPDGFVLYVSEGI
jgi:hypothetical protein